MVLLFIASLAGFFISAALIVWALWPDESARIVRKRLQAEVGQEGGSLILRQLAILMTPINRLLPLGGYILKIQKRLDAAGLRVPAAHFIVIQELGAVVGLGAFMYLAGMGPMEFNPGLLFIFVVIGFTLPTLWVNGRIRSRREAVSRDLPEVVDLLSLCVGAGADFMSALSRIVREYRPCPVREELGIVLSEVRVGKRRRDALKAFSDRLQTSESSTFSRTLIQADRMGTGLVDALGVLSDDMRMQRYHWAERYAQRAPIKMLVPLMLSLGASMIIVAGPILIQFLRGGWFQPMHQMGQPGPQPQDVRK